MKMPMKKIFRWVNRPGLMLLTLCFVFLCAFQSLCNAQLEATAKPDGEIELVWPGGNADEKLREARAVIQRNAARIPAVQSKINGLLEGL